MTDRARNAGRLVAIVGATSAALLFALVPEHEGVVHATYRDPIGIVTACVGHTGPELRMGQTFTRAECQQMLEGDLIKHARGVQDCVLRDMNDNQLAAFTSLAFNVGVRAFCRSTVVRLFERGDAVGACRAIEMWNKAGGKVLKGLVRRRAAERALCEREPLKTPPARVEGVA